MIIRKSSVLPAILCAVVVLIAVSGSFSFMIPHSTLLALMICAMLAGLLNIIKYHNVNWTLPYLCIMFWIIVSKNCYLGTNIPNLIYYILTYLLCIILCLAAPNMPNWINPTLKGLKWCLMIYAIATVWLRLDKNSYINLILPLFPDTADTLMIQYNAGSMAGLTNHYSTNGMFLATLVSLCVAQLIANGSNNKHKIAVGCSVIALLLTGKRAHIGFTLIAVFCLLYFCYSDNARNRLQKLFAILIVGSIAVVILFSLVPSLAVVWERFQEASQLEDPTLGRTEMISIAMAVFLGKPLNGIGWGRTQEMVFVKTNIHNVYVQLLAETGIIGFVVFVGWFLIMLFSIIRRIIAIRRQRICARENELYHLSFACCFQIFFLLYCFTGNPLYDRMMFIPYFITCGINLYYNSRNPWEE